MQKEWKRPGIFSLWETKLLILIFVATTGAVIASRHVADDRIAQAAVLARQQEVARRFAGKLTSLRSMTIGDISEELAALRML